MAEARAYMLDTDLVVTDDRNIVLPEMKNVLAYAEYARQENGRMFVPIFHYNVIRGETNGWDPKPLRVGSEACIAEVVQLTWDQKKIKHDETFPRITFYQVIGKDLINKVIAEYDELVREYRSGMRSIVAKRKSTLDKILNMQNETDSWPKDREWEERRHYHELIEEHRLTKPRFENIAGKYIS